MKRALFVVASLLLGAPASAADGEMIVPASRALARPITMQGKPKILAYGPVAVTREVKTTKDTIYVYVEGATFGGRAGSVQFYLAFPPKGSFTRKPLRINGSDYVGSFGSMEGSPAGEITQIEEINNFEVKGVPFRPRDHLQGATEVIFAMVSPPKHFKFDRVVITTEAPEQRESRKDATTAPPCEPRLMFKWELGKIAENCMAPRACVVDERLTELACAGSKTPEACMSKCLSSGLAMIGKAFHAEPPESNACVACLSRGYAKFIASCGADCPACPPDSPQAARCDQCARREKAFAACMKPER